MSGLEQIEGIAATLLARVGPAERRRLLRKVAGEVRKGQSARIGRQEAPDGQRFAARRAKADPKPGAYPVRFLYPKGAAEPRVVLMKSWTREGATINGYDIEAGGLRTFVWDRIAKWLPLDKADKGKAGGKLRRRGRIRQKAMFRRLRLNRFLKTGATDEEAWIGFTGRAAEIARVSQEGGMDRPSPKAKPVRYARRELLGFTEADRTAMVDAVLAHLGG